MPPTPQPRGQLPVYLGVGVVLLLLGAVLGYQVRRPAHHTTITSSSKVNNEGEDLSVTGVSDSFDRPDDPSSLGTSPTGMMWRADAGTWGIVGGQAAPLVPAPGHSFAVVPLGNSDGAVQVQMAKVADGAGLVFRYQDPRNYWAVTAAPYYATWVVSRTVDARTQVVANTGLSATHDGTTLAVRMTGDVIDVAVEAGVRKTISDGALLHSSMVGLMVSGISSTAPRFDDFEMAAVASPPVSPPTDLGTSTTVPGDASTTTPTTQVVPDTTAVPAPSTAPRAPLTTNRTGGRRSLPPPG